MCQLTSNHSIDLFAVFSTFYIASERENPLTPLEISTIGKFESDTS